MPWQTMQSFESRRRGVAGGSFSNSTLFVSDQAEAFYEFVVILLLLFYNYYYYLVH
jgi:hypothetical protein